VSSSTSSPAPASPFRAGHKVDRKRLQKLDQLRLRGREPYPDVHLRSRVLAAEIHAAHDPTALAVGEHGRWRYAVAGRVVARRKHRHATFLDLEDQSGVIELSLRREATSAHGSQLLDADIGDVVSAEGSVYVTDNHKLTLCVASSQLLAKALRLPPSPAPSGDRPRRSQLDALALGKTRTLVEARSAALYALRRWMRQNDFVEVSQPAPAGSRTARQLYLRRCLLAGLERVFESHAAPLRGGADTTTTLQWSAAYVDCKTIASQASELIAEAAGAISATLPGAATPDGRWRAITLREGIEACCEVDILAADAGALRRRLGDRADDLGASWDVLVGALYRNHVLPTLTQPTIVYDFPLADRPLAKRHPLHAALADSFSIVIGGVTVASGHNELNDPQEQWARLLERRGLTDEPGGQRSGPIAYEREIRLLEYGLCPAAGAELQLDPLLALMNEPEALPSSRETDDAGA
jgi:lysyl-tRNA synthetase class 2